MEGEWAGEVSTRLCALLLFARAGKTEPGPQVPYLEVRGLEGAGKQALASPAQQLCSGVSQPGPSLFCSPAAAPRGGNRGGLG